MRWDDTLKTALAALHAYRARAMLTMLGIVIGTASVVLVVSLVRGARGKVERSLLSLNANVLTVAPANSASTTSGGQSLVNSDVENLRAIPGVLGVAPVSPAAVVVKRRTRAFDREVIGTTPEYLLASGHKLERGVFINARDVRGTRKVAVLGQRAASFLFSSLDPLGQRIYLQGVGFEVVGITRSDHSFEADQIIIPYTTVRAALFGDATIAHVQVISDGVRPWQLLRDEIERTLAVAHNRVASDSVPFRAYAREEAVAAVRRVADTFGALLSAIAAVSLIVGGIGVMNIMLVVVRERTREIGIRLALGARRADIVMQFLAEATAVSTLGGILGILVAVVAALALRAWAGIPMQITGSSLLLALFGAAATGITFGVWPAREASLLHPVAALRSN